MFKCKECNSTVIEEDIYCRNCGVELQLDYSEAETIVDYTLNTEEEMVLVQENDIDNQDSAYIEKRIYINWKNEKVILIILIAVIICSIAGYFLNKNLYTSNNSVGRNFMVKSGGWRYFTYTRNDVAATESEEFKIYGGIYKLGKNGSKSIKVYNDYAVDLAVKGKWIYYASAKERKIYKVKTDGSERTVLVEELGFHLTIHGDYLYYLPIHTNGGTNKLCRIKLNGGDEQKIAGDISINNFYIIGEKIYYTTSLKPGSLMKMNLDGSGKEEALSFFGHIAYIDENYIYYIEPSQESINKYRRDIADSNSNVSFYGTGKAYKMTLNGKQRQCIISDEVIEFILSGKYIYYTTSNDLENNSYRVDLYGKNKKQIKIDNIGYIFGIDDNWIYYLNKQDNKLYMSSFDQKKVECISIE